MVAPITDWIADTPDESVMKAQPEAFLNGTGTDPIAIIVTERPRSQSEASFTRAFGLKTNPAQYETLAKARSILADAPNVTVTIVNFADLIDTPDQVFDSLAAAGWPIDPATAAATIDPALYRNR